MSYGKSKRTISCCQEGIDCVERSVGRKDISDLERDGAIQCFEFTYEAVWKAAQAYLAEYEKVSIASPRGIVRESFKAGLLSEADARKIMDMADDRNFAVHTYNEELAKKIYRRLTGHEKIMEKWLTAIEHRLSE